MTGPGESADDGGVTVDVLRGSPTEEELAALVAVVTESYQREAAEALADDTPARSAWAVSARSLRQPLRRDVRWGQFSQ